MTDGLPTPDLIRDKLQDVLSRLRDEKEKTEDPVRVAILEIMIHHVDDAITHRRTILRHLREDSTHNDQ